MEPITKTYPNGWTVELVAYREYLWQWYRGRSESGTEAWMINTVEPNWTCVDVGAHVGTYTMLLARLCRQVYAFEASKATFKMLEANMAHNGLMAAKYNMAVGSAPGVRVATLWYAGLAKRASDCAVTEEHRFCTLDGFLKWPSIDLHRLDLVKIDVDGWDYDALMGGTHVLREFRPLVVIEYTDASWERRRRNDLDLFRFAIEYDYAICLLDADARTYLMKPRERVI